MSVPQLVICFAMCWWLILFMALPFGVTPDDSPVPGSVESAPAKPRLLLKMAVTTVLAGLVTVAVDQVVRAGWIEFRPPVESEASPEARKLAGSPSRTAFPKRPDAVLQAPPVIV